MLVAGYAVEKGKEGFREAWRCSAKQAVVGRAFDPAETRRPEVEAASFGA